MGSWKPREESFQKFNHAAKRLGITRTKKSPLVLATRKSWEFFSGSSFSRGSGWPDDSV